MRRETSFVARPRGVNVTSYCSYHWCSSSIVIIVFHLLILTIVTIVAATTAIAAASYYSLSFLFILSSWYGASASYVDTWDPLAGPRSSSPIGLSSPSWATGNSDSLHGVRPRRAV